MTELLRLRGYMALRECRRPGCAIPAAAAAVVAVVAVAAAAARLRRC